MDEGEMAETGCGFGAAGAVALFCACFCSVSFVLFFQRGVLQESCVWIPLSFCGGCFWSFGFGSHSHLRWLLLVVWVWIPLALAVVAFSRFVRR